VTFEQLRLYVCAVLDSRVGVTDAAIATIVDAWPAPGGTCPLDYIEELDDNIAITTARRELNDAHKIVACARYGAETAAAKEIVAIRRRRLADAIVDACIPPGKPQ
jgi:hypothetical protein